MQIFDFFASIDSQFNDFNRGVMGALQKINDFGVGIQTVANDVNRSITDMSNAITEMSDSMDRFAISMTTKNNGLIASLAQFNTFITAVKGFDNSIGAAINATVLWTQKTALLTLGKTALGIAMKGIGIGLFIAGINALAQAVPRLIDGLARGSDSTRQLREEQQKLIDSANRLVDSQISSASAHQSQIHNIETEAEASMRLLSRMEELYQSGDKSERQRRQMAAYVEKLNHSMEGLNLQYDTETGLLSQSIQAIELQIEARKEQARVAAALDRSVEIAREQIVAEEQLSKIQAQREEVLERLNSSEKMSRQERGYWEKQSRELYEAEKELQEQHDQLGESFKHVSSIIAASMMANTEAITDYADTAEYELAKAAYAAEAMAKAQKTALDSLAKEYTSLKGAALDMFSTLSDESSLSVADMTGNLEENQRVISQWADNIAALADRGIDEGLLEKLRQAGPQSAGHVRALVESSGDELIALNDAFINGGETALQALASLTWKSASLTVLAA